MDLIRASQVAPNDLDTHMREFLRELNSIDENRTKLQKWGYEYESSPNAKHDDLRIRYLSRHCEEESRPAPLFHH